MIKHYLNKINVTLNYVTFSSWNTFNEACKSDSSQLFLTVWNSDVLGDPENFLYSLFYSRSQYNFMNYENEQVDRWLDSVRREPDREIRREIYTRIVGQIIDDTPAVFLYHVIPVFAYNRQRIRQLPVTPYGIIQFHRVLLNE